MPLLEIEDLTVELPAPDGTSAKVIDNVSFSLESGEILGVVGESGAGKSMTGAAVIGLLEPPLRISAGEIRVDGRNICGLSAAEMRQVRGRLIGSIFQDPLTTLNPLFTVGRQLTDTMLAHLPITKQEARDRAVAWLEKVGIPAAGDRIEAYPHEFSGGMRQRVVIALALCAEPKLIIADEPTTALDVSVQAQIIELIERLSRENGLSVILITHDMGVVAEITHRAAVMYAGRIVEIGPTEDVILRPRHPYAKGLMDSIPPMGSRLASLPQISGSMPRVGRLPSGCAYHPRCPSVTGRCRSDRPGLVRSGTSLSACWLAGEPSVVEMEKGRIHV